MFTFVYTEPTGLDCWVNLSWSVCLLFCRQSKSRWLQQRRVRQRHIRRPRTRLRHWAGNTDQLRQTGTSNTAGVSVWVVSVWIRHRWAKTLNPQLLQSSFTEYECFYCRVCFNGGCTVWAPRSYSHQQEWSRALGGFYGDHETRLICTASRCLAHVPVRTVSSRHQCQNTVLFGDRAERESVCV